MHTYIKVNTLYVLYVHILITDLIHSVFLHPCIYYIPSSYLIKSTKLL